RCPGDHTPTAGPARSRPWRRFPGCPSRFARGGPGLLGHPARFGHRHCGSPPDRRRSDDGTVTNQVTRGQDLLGILTILLNDLITLPFQQAIKPVYREAMVRRELFERLSRAHLL